MKVRIGVVRTDSLSGDHLPNVHDLTPALEMFHGDGVMVYADSGYQGIEKQSETAESTAEFRVANRPGNRKALPDTSEGRL